MNSSKMEISNDTCGEDPLSSTEITEMKNEPKEEPEKFDEMELEMPINGQKQPEFKHKIDSHENTFKQDMIGNSQQCIKQEDSNIKHDIEPFLQLINISKSESDEQFHNKQLKEKSSKNENGTSFEADYNLLNSNTFYSEAVREKCNLEQLSEKDSFAEEISVNKENDVDSPTCLSFNVEITVNRKSNVDSQTCVSFDNEITVNKKSDIDSQTCISFDNEIMVNKKYDVDSHTCVFSSVGSFLLQNDATVHNSIKGDLSLSEDVSVKIKFCQECNKSLNLYMCKICKRVFTDENLIENHIYSHKRALECEICHKSFSNKHKLNKHVIIHTDERPYSCEICNKSFNHSSNLLRHINDHSKIRPYKCENCPKTFVVKTELRLHMRRHTGERPHQCDICSKTYLRKAYLNNHMKIHTAKHLYECEICSKTFTTSLSLYNHLYIHSGASPYKCEECKKSFTTRSSLARHHLKNCISKFT